MKILIITQKVNENDHILGFFCSWLNELAKNIAKLYVIALEKGNADLAKNIELYSLDKENGSGRLRRFLKFNWILANLCLNKKVDIIFIHMCPEYAILTWPYARLRNIPILMWYAHGHVNTKLRIAHILVDKILTPSQESFRIKSNKAIVIGHGIDIYKFAPQNEGGFRIHNNGKKIILSVGRISPVKNYETLIEAANILVNQKGIRDLIFQVVGDASLKLQERYLDFLKDMVKKYNLEDYIQFIGPIAYTHIHNYYQNCDLFVSTSNTGSLDKAVLEAMACQKLISTSNEAFRNLLGNYSGTLMFDKNNASSLAEKIGYILNMSQKDKDILRYNLREIVMNNHNLNNLIDNILSVFKETISV